MSQNSGETPEDRSMELSPTQPAVCRCLDALRRMIVPQGHKVRLPHHSTTNAIDMSHDTATSQCTQQNNIAQNAHGGPFGTLSGNTQRNLTGIDHHDEKACQSSGGLGFLKSILSRVVSGQNSKNQKALNRQKVPDNLANQVVLGGEGGNQDDNLAQYAIQGRAGPQINGVPQNQEGAGAGEQHIFRFLQRYEYLQQKFAPKREYYHINRNSRTLGDLLQVRTTLEGNEVQYCESLNGNLFLLKYFKYECSLCQKLCSHILQSDFCCKSSICLQCCQQICDQLEEIILQESYQEEQCSIALGECLFCNKSLPQTSKTLLIRDPTPRELQMIAKRTSENIKKREREGLSESKQVNAIDTVRGSEQKQQNTLQANNPVMMSAVKPMRLSFKHILEHNDNNTTAAGSPFKKRLNDIFTTGAAGKGGIFAFEDIILNTQNNSPEKPMERIGSKSNYTYQQPRRDKNGYMEGSPSRNKFEMHFINNVEDEEEGNVHQCEAEESGNGMEYGEDQLRIKRYDQHEGYHYPQVIDEDENPSQHTKGDQHTITVDSIKVALKEEKLISNYAKPPRKNKRTKASKKASITTQSTGQMQSIDEGACIAVNLFSGSQGGATRKQLFGREQSNKENVGVFRNLTEELEESSNEDNAIGVLAQRGIEID